MELLLMLFVGALAGSMAGVLNGLLGSALWKSQASDNAKWPLRSVTRELAALAVYLFAGAMIGLLFWSSWGLTAIISVPWWLRGASFATLCWLALCCPLVALQALSARVTWRFVAKTALDSLLLCVVVGLACAWNWAKSGP